MLPHTACSPFLIGCLCHCLFYALQHPWQRPLVVRPSPRQRMRAHARPHGRHDELLLLPAVAVSTAPSHLTPSHLATLASAGPRPPPPWPASSSLAARHRRAPWSLALRVARPLLVVPGQAATACAYGQDVHSSTPPPSMPYYTTAVMATSVLLVRCHRCAPAGRRRSRLVCLGMPPARP